MYRELWRLQMQVIKEVWLLKNLEFSGYMCAQNTQTPKLFVSEKSAATSALANCNNNVLTTKPVKAFIVIEGDQDEVPF